MGDAREEGTSSAVEETFGDCEGRCLPRSGEEAVLMETARDREHLEMVSIPTVDE